MISSRVWLYFRWKRVLDVGRVARCFSVRRSKMSRVFLWMELAEREHVGSTILNGK